METIEDLNSYKIYLHLFKRFQKLKECREFKKIRQFKNFRHFVFKQLDLRDLMIIKNTLIKSDIYANKQRTTISSLFSNLYRVYKRNYNLIVLFNKKIKKILSYLSFCKSS